MINEENKHSWCVNAVHAMSGNNNGNTKICCMFSPKENVLVLGTDPISQHFNKPEFIEVRQSLENGIRHPGCRDCWKEEDSGRKSKRMRDNDRYLHEVKWNRVQPYNGLAKFELNLGNTCNLSCRTCGPAISSGWMKEDYDTNYTDTTYKEYAVRFKKYHQTYDEDSEFWIDLEGYLPNIQQFDFYGGEPLMSKKMWDALNTARKLGYSKNIELHYNTNATHFPKEVEYWKNFKSVNLSFSIDGIGSKFEYMRYPAKWSEALDNMNKFLDLSEQYGNMQLSWCITLSTLNIFDTPEVLDFYYNHFASRKVGMYLNLVHGPGHYNISILPTEIKEKITKRLESVPRDRREAWNHIPGVVNFMNSGSYDNYEFKKFIELTKKSDTYRNQNFLETFKDYGKYFTDYFV